MAYLPGTESAVSSNTKTMADYFKQLSSGKRINSAADDAAGLAIANKLGAQANGLVVGIRNTEDMQSLLKTADGGLDVMSGALQRVRELGVQAMNGIYTDEDKALIQNEVSGLLDDVKSYAQSTQFNSIKVLDGSFVDKNLASDPNGSGMKISIANSTLESLGLDNFNVTGSFDLSAVDNAINAVNEARSKIGAQISGADYIISANEIAYINAAGAKSRVEDADMAEASTNLNKTKFLEQAQIYSMKSQMDMLKQKSGILM